MNKYICWFSCGAASAVATKIALKKYKNVRIIYQDTGSEHPDNKRFLKDCEQWFGQEIEITKSEKYNDIWDVFKKTKWLVGPSGARCTSELKRKVAESIIDWGENQQFEIFGYTFEDMRFIVGPSAEAGKQPRGAMGNDAPLAVLSDQPQLLYNYFKQLFAQVTNPPIDPIREELVTASISFVGSEGDLTRPSADSCRMIKFESPLIDRKQLAQLRHIDLPGFKATRLPILFESAAGGLESGHNAIVDPRISGKGLEAALEQLFENADAAIRDGCLLYTSPSPRD